jgi:hypothetical protein
MIREEQSSVIATHVNIILAARDLYPKNDGDEDDELGLTQYL